MAPSYGMELIADPSVIALLGFIGICAGVLESTAGGSGLIVLPVLMMMGFSPAQAMGTSKLQYEFGAAVSIFRFHRAAYINWRAVWPLALVSAVAGATGAVVLVNTDIAFLRIIVPLLLMLVGIYFMVSPRLADEIKPAHTHHAWLTPLLVAVLGLYDGFMGVGSASFVMMAIVYCLGMAARQATATTKVIDFSSATAALAVLAVYGEVLWIHALVLGFGQMIGAWIGAGLVIDKGARFIRPMLVVVSLALSLKLLADYYL